MTVTCHRRSYNPTQESNMDGKELAAFIVFMVALVYIYRIKHGNKDHTTAETLKQTLFSQQQQIEQLQQRVATLETIITDSKYDLKKQIDSL